MQKHDWRPGQDGTGKIKIISPKGPPLLFVDDVTFVECYYCITISFPSSILLEQLSIGLCSTKYLYYAGFPVCYLTGYVVLTLQDQIAFDEFDGVVGAKIILTSNYKAKNNSYSKTCLFKLKIFCIVSKFEQSQIEKEFKVRFRHNLAWH